MIFFCYTHHLNSRWYNKRHDLVYKEKHQNIEGGGACAHVPVFVWAGWVGSSSFTLIQPLMPDFHILIQGHVFVVVFYRERRGGKIVPHLSSDTYALTFRRCRDQTMSVVFGSVSCRLACDQCACVGFYNFCQSLTRISKRQPGSTLQLLAQNV